MSLGYTLGALIASIVHPFRREPKPEVQVTWHPQTAEQIAAWQAELEADLEYLTPDWTWDDEENGEAS